MRCGWWVGKSMTTITLPAGTKYVRFGNVAHLVASALRPLGDDATGAELLAHGAVIINMDDELEAAVRVGTLPVKDPLTLGPHTFPNGAALLSALVRVDDLRAFVAGRDIDVAIAPAAPQEPVDAKVPATIVHSTKTRRDTLTPVIELAQQKCRDPQDPAEVWAVLLLLAEKKQAPLIGATEDGLQYLRHGEADIFTRKSLGARLSRQRPARPANAR